MIEFKSRLFPPTIDAPSLELFEQIAPHFPSKQLTALILHSHQFWIVEQGGIEFDPLDLDARDGCPSGIAGGPGQHIADP